MRITGGQVFDLQEGFVQRDVCFDGRLLSNSSADGQTYDASGCYVIPGLTDLHFHGCMGKDFSDADPEGLEIMAKYELSQGVTQICPAGMTLLEKIMYLADYIEPSRDFPGVDKLRAVCYKDLDEGLLLGLEMTIEEMTSMGNPVHHATIEARDALKG